MCYHISFEVKLESIKDLFPELVIDNQLDIDFPQNPYHNGFDHGVQPVMVKSRKDQHKHLALMMWGFLPGGIKNREEAEKFWTGYKDENGKWRTGYTTLNATGEDLLQKKMYRDAALHRRCILFTDGFYEWHHYYPIGKKGKQLKTAVKYPHHILQKENNKPMMMAGIWNPWRFEELNEETGELEQQVVPTFAIVTTAANSLMAQIHNSKNRMPVLLDKELAEQWISNELPEEEISKIATFQMPANKLVAYSVAPDFQKSSAPKIPHEYEDLKLDFC